MVRTYVAEGEPTFDMEIFEGENKIKEQTYDTKKCCVCGRTVSKNYRVYYEDEQGAIQDVTISREGGLCRTCAVFDMLHGLDPDAPAPARAGSK